MSARFLGVGWQCPVAVTADGDGTHHLALAEYQDSIEQAIRIILETAKGERVMRPDFGCGIHDLVFAVNDSGTQGLAEFEVREALLLWEPRIEVLNVKVTPGGDLRELMIIAIDYRVRATDHRFNLVYPFYLERGLP